MKQASCLLIVVGNPYNLQRKENWRKFIEFCTGNYLNFGEKTNLCEFAFKEPKYQNEYEDDTSLDEAIKEDPKSVLGNKPNRHNDIIHKTMKLKLDLEVPSQTKSFFKETDNFEIPVTKINGVGNDLLDQPNLDLKRAVLKPAIVKKVLPSVDEILMKDNFYVASEVLRPVSVMGIRNREDDCLLDLNGVDAYPITMKNSNQTLSESKFHSNQFTQIYLNPSSSSCGSDTQSLCEDDFFGDKSSSQDNCDTCMKIMTSKPFGKITNEDLELIDWKVTAAPEPEIFKSSSTTQLDSRLYQELLKFSDSSSTLKQKSNQTLTQQSISQMSCSILTDKISHSTNPFIEESPKLPDYEEELEFVFKNPFVTNKPPANRAKSTNPFLDVDFDKFDKPDDFTGILGEVESTSYSSLEPELDSGNGK